eukprot:3574893-Alexandrium_andersonii.AAC.1
MSSWNCRSPLPVPRPSESSDHAGPPDSPSTGAPKSAALVMRASSISRSVAGSAFSAISAASLCSSSSSGRESSARS